CRFAGKTSEVALVFGGVHAHSEPEGIILAKALKRRLTDLALARIKPVFTVVLIPQLFAPKRFSARDPRKIPVPNPRKPNAAPLLQDPNRNFPQPGESYAYACARAALETDSEQASTPLGSPLGGMLAENRIL